MTTQRILIVYDRTQVSEPYSDLLAEMDCEIHMACDNLTALKLVNDTDPNLLILDADFAERDNFDFCQRLNSTPPKFIRPSVVVVTSRNELADVENVVAAGVDDFISKPFNADELLKRIENLLLLNALNRRS